LILVDANLLIYAHDSSSPLHAQARHWLEGVASGAEPVGVAWSSLLAFLRITTHARVFERPLATAEACQRVSALLEQPAMRLLRPGPRHWEILERLLIEGQARGALLMDAHLAALALEHGAVVCTTDKDFSRFEGLRIQNPVRR